MSAKTKKTKEVSYKKSLVVISVCPWWCVIDAHGKCKARSRLRSVLLNRLSPALSVEKRWFVMEGATPLLCTEQEGEFPVGYAGFSTREEAETFAKWWHEKYLKSPHEYTVEKVLKL